MLDSRDIRVQPASPVSGAAAVRPIDRQRPPVLPGSPVSPPEPSPVAEVAVGNARAAYSEFVVDADTHDVVLRVRDAATDQVISELPSRDMQELSKYLKHYAETMAQRKAALHGGIAG